MLPMQGQKHKAAECPEPLLEVQTLHTTHSTSIITLPALPTKARSQQIIIGRPAQLQYALGVHRFLCVSLWRACARIR